MVDIQPDQLEWIANARRLIDFLEGHPNLIPNYSAISLHVTTLDVAEFIGYRTSAGGAWNKEEWGSSFGLSKHFGDHRYYIWIDRTKVCEKVVTTRHVEAVPEHDEEVVEWVCPDSFLDELNARVASAD